MRPPGRYIYRLVNLKVLRLQKPRCRLSEEAEMLQIRGKIRRTLANPACGGTSYGFPEG